jgi:hypothetical protein
MTREGGGEKMTTKQAVAKLRACRSLLGSIDQSGQGITYQLSEAELTLLQGFEDVANTAASRPDGEGWFNDVRSRAGLAPSSSGLLAGVLHRWYASHVSPEAQIEQLKRSLAREWGNPTPDE